MEILKQKIAALAESLKGDWFQSDFAGFEGKLIEVLNLLADKIESSVPARIVTEDIQNLSSPILESLKAGDVVLKNDVTGEHAYLVSYRGEGGLCLTYTDCENVETLAYNKVEGVWAFDDKTVTHIGS